jgi:hypothetical protein
MKTAAERIAELEALNLIDFSDDDGIGRLALVQAFGEFATDQQALFMKRMGITHRPGTLEKRTENVSAEDVQKLALHLLDLSRESNAGVGRLSFMDKDGKSIAACIYAEGPDTDEILEAVDAVTDSWHETRISFDDYGIDENIDEFTFSDTDEEEE